MRPASEETEECKPGNIFIRGHSTLNSHTTSKQQQNPETNAIRKHIHKYFCISFSKHVSYILVDTFVSSGNKVRLSVLILELLYFCDYIFFLYSLSQEQNSGLVQRLISQRNTLIQPGRLE